jgi:hypothetical protein
MMDNIGSVPQTMVPSAVFLRPRLGWSALVAAVWAAAGGAAAGALVAALLLAGRLHPDGSASITLLLATIGSMLGVVHGAVLGYLGRHAGEDLRLGLIDRIFALFVAAAALLASVGLALWIVMSAVLLRSGLLWGWLAFLAGATAVVAIAVWATVLGWLSLERAYLEWPQHRLGASLLAGSFLVLCTVFLLLQPSVPGTSLQLRATGWIIVAALATIWVATPVVVLTLRIGRRNVGSTAMGADRGVGSIRHGDARRFGS